VHDKFWLDWYLDIRFIRWVFKSWNTIFPLFGIGSRVVFGDVFYVMAVVHSVSKSI
jgi:hypothetical protein